jgi:sugar transferase (PEP-CTERM system associated)
MRQVLSGHLPVRTALLIVSEHVLIVLCVAIAAALRLDVPTVVDQFLTGGLAWRASLIAAVLQVSLHFCDLYDLRTLGERREVVVALLQALGAASLVLAVLYYLVPTLVISRGVVMIASALIVLLIAGWRMAFDWLSLRLEPAERLLIVGTNPAAVDLARELFHRRQELGVELIGFVDSDPSRVGTALINPGVLGVIDDIPRIVRDRRVDRVVVSLADARGKLSMDQLLQMKLQDGVRFDHLASVYEDYTGKIAVENLRPSWLIFSEGFRHSRRIQASKRLFDILFGAIGILITAPVQLLVALAIRIASDGPILYSQERVGKDGRPFTIYKFRTMRVNAEALTGPVWSTVGDPRVTPLGRFLRRTRLDELPQLWNVLVGDMSVVGPRPERPEFVSDLTRQIPFYGQRHVVRPGVTGWAQVRYSYAASLEDSLQKLQYDLFYIKHLSVAFDLFIILETVKTVLVRRGS